MTRQWKNGPAAFADDSLGQAGSLVADLFEGNVLPLRFFHYFMTDGSAELMKSSAGRPVLRFGFSRGSDVICLALDDLSVVELTSRDNSIVSFVNTSMEKLIDFLGLCEDRYPYYPAAEDEDEDEGDFLVSMQAADRLRAELLPIDEPALAPGTYWSDFLSDVANGDYS
jgi:hypothetical protein